MKKNKKKEGKKKWDDSHLCLDNAKSIGRKIKKWKINKNREMTVKKKNEIAATHYSTHYQYSISIYANVYNFTGQKVVGGGDEKQKEEEKNSIEED